MSLKKWYALQVMSGRENSVKGRILEQLERSDASVFVDELSIPSTTTVETKGSKRVERVERLMPGYILVHADWESCGQLLLSVSGVIGFSGQADNPTPLPLDQVQRLLGRKQESMLAYSTPFKVGDTVRITSGPLSDFTGEVLQVHEKILQATVEVQIFGRATPTQLAWLHLQLQ
jgi:transcriptional antiterminator NusG